MEVFTSKPHTSPKYVWKSALDCGGLHEVWRRRGTGACRGFSGVPLDAREGNKWSLRWLSGDVE